MIDPKDVTIIIPHLGGSEEAEYALEKCYQSLKETVPNIRIIVVVNGAMQCKGHDDILNDEIAESIIAVGAQGQCKAVNAAAATVNTPWIFITNDDMIYAPGWFEKLVEPLGTKFLIAKNGLDLIDLAPRPGAMIPVQDLHSVIQLAEILCISPKLVEPRPGAPTFETHFCGGAGGDFNKEEWEQYVRERPIPMEKLLPGFNFPLLIKKDLWNLIEGYDVNYDPWGSNSDSDLEYKIRLAGIQPYQNQDCVVYHFSQTSGTFEPKNTAYWQKNFQYFIDKWGFPRTDDGIWEASFYLPTPEEGRIFKPHWEGFYAKQ